MPNILPVPKEMLAVGFVADDGETPRRMLVGSDGLEKTGKTNLWLTAPGVIAGINLDIGLEGVIHKYSKKKSVWVLSYNVPPPVGTSSGIITQTTYLQHLNQVRKAYDAALAHKDVRTVVIDTGTDLWELIRLADFGTVTPKSAAGSLSYVTANQMYRGMVRQAYDSDKNLIITHKLNKKWVSTTDAAGKKTNTWDGTYERDGFNGDGYLIQVNVRHTFDYATGQFGMTIENCRQNFGLAGFEFSHEECNWQSLGVAVFPESSVGDWK